MLVIAAVWFVIACVVIAACRAAARGDAAMSQDAEQARRRATLAGVVLWERERELSAQDLRPSPSMLDVAARLTELAGR